jgi:D-alanine-D-alanine ligase
MRTIAVLGGGNSSEFDISVKSATEVAKSLSGRYNTYLIMIRGNDWYWEDPNGRAVAIDKNRFTLTLHDTVVRFDAVFIVIHGTPGENGLMQGYFDMLAIPYAGCDAFCSALTFNKQATKAWLREYDIPMARSFFFRKGDTRDIEKILSVTGLPCFVKPNNSGSSFGVSIVSVPEELDGAIDNALKESDEVLIEWLMRGTEVACGVIRTKAVQQALPVTEIRSKNAFFDFEAKYDPSKADEITPAEIEPEVYSRVQSLSSEIYDILGCRGMVRVDFIIVDNTPMFLEINTIPGLTAESILPKQIAASGMEAADLYSMIIEDLFS